MTTMKLELETLIASRKAAAACPHCNPVAGDDAGRVLLDPLRWEEDSAWRGMTAGETAQKAKFEAWRAAENAVASARDAAASAVHSAFAALSEAQKLVAILCGPHVVRYSNGERVSFAVLTKYGKREWGGIMVEGDIFSYPEYIVATEDWEAFGWRMLGLRHRALDNSPRIQIRSRPRYGDHTPQAVYEITDRYRGGGNRPNDCPEPC